MYISRSGAPVSISLRLCPRCVARSLGSGDLGRAQMGPGVSAPWTCKGGKATPLLILLLIREEEVLAAPVRTRENITKSAEVTAGT